MDPKTLFNKAADQAEGCLKHVHTDQLTEPTPCSEWNLKALINHLVYELLWVPDLLAGKTIAEVGDKYEGDVLGEDLRAAWRSALDNAKAAVQAADLDAAVHLSYGNTLARDYITEVADELAIHGWDVAQSIKCNVIFDTKMAQTLYEFMQPRRGDPTGTEYFGATVSVPDDAPVGDKLLALTGRNREWQAK